MIRTKRHEPEQPIIYALLQEDPLRELFEACKSGDLNKVRRQINAETVNARDTTGRKSTPLHFAAGKIIYSDLISTCNHTFCCAL